MAMTTRTPGTLSCSIVLAMAGILGALSASCADPVGTDAEECAQGFDCVMEKCLSKRPEPIEPYCEIELGTDPPQACWLDPECIECDRCDAQHVICGAGESCFFWWELCHDSCVEGTACEDAYDALPWVREYHRASKAYDDCAEDCGEFEELGRYHPHGIGRDRALECIDLAACTGEGGVQCEPVPPGCADGESACASFEPQMEGYGWLSGHASGWDISVRLGWDGTGEIWLSSCPYGSYRSTALLWSSNEDGVEIKSAVDENIPWLEGTSPRLKLSWPAEGCIIARPVGGDAAPDTVNLVVWSDCEPGFDVDACEAGGSVFRCPGLESCTGSSG